METSEGPSEAAPGEGGRREEDYKSQVASGGPVLGQGKKLQLPGGIGKVGAGR